MYKKSKILKAMRIEMENGNLLGIAMKRAGMKRAIVYHWRKRPLIDKYIKECRKRCQERRNEIVEDGQFKRMADGHASAHDYEFYLTRRDPERWPAKDPTQNVVVIIQQNRYKDVKDEDLDGVINSYLKRR